MTLAMRNEYEIRGDITAIFIFRKGVTLECLIDTEDLPRLLEFGRTWRTRWCEASKTHYVVAHSPAKRGAGIQIHRLLTNAPVGMPVDHIHHNGLDNRKSELRVCTPSQNSVNRRLDHFNKHGKRGVCLTQHGTYRGAVKIGGHFHYLGSFKTAEEAGAAVSEAIKSGDFSKKARKHWGVQKRIADEFGISQSLVCMTLKGQHAGSHADAIRSRMRELCA